MKVRVYYLRGRPDHSEIQEVKTIQKWMLDNLYDLVWEAEFKNVVTPDIIATRFRLEPNPFGISFKKKTSHTDLTAGDLIQIGSTNYLVLPEGFREMNTHIPE